MAGQGSRAGRGAALESGGAGLDGTHRQVKTVDCGGTSPGLSSVRWGQPFAPHRGDQKTKLGSGRPVLGEAVSLDGGRLPAGH